ncbi:MAG: type II toxin-antitoxin system RelE/ParE family toxin [Caldilineaceae bacterium]
MVYHLKISREIAKQIDRLPGKVKHRIGKTINDLRTNPLPPEALALSGDLEGLYRIRLEDWRIIYSIDHNQIVIEIIRVGRRGQNTYGDLM